jgi:hypothetical protein
LSCQTNSVKAKAAAAAAGASGAAGKAAYAAGVSAGALGGGVLGGVGGAAGGALLGAAGGAATGIVLGPSGIATGAATGALGGAVGGGVVGGVGGAALGVKGVRRLVRRQSAPNDGRLTRRDRTVIRAGRVGGGLGMAWVGGTLGSMAGGPVGGALGVVGGAALGSSSLGPAARAERALRLKRWREGGAGQQAKAEFVAKVRGARENRRPGLKGQLGYFKQVARFQQEFDTRASREALGA